MNGPSPIRWGIVPFLLGLSIGPGCTTQGEDLATLPASAPEPTECVTGNTPVLSLGREDLARDSETHFAAVQDAVLLPSGRFAVAETDRLLLFDTEGRAQGTIGRQGSGPGEFRRLGRIWYSEARGEIIAYDTRLRRLTWLTGEGSVIKLLQIGPSPDGRPPLEVPGVFADGSILVGFAVAPLSAGTEGGRLWTDSLDFYRLSPEGSPRDFLGRFAQRERYSDFRFGFSVIARPFGRNPGYFLLGEHFAAYDGIHPTLVLLSQVGTVMEEIELPDGRGPVPDEFVQADREERISLSPLPPRTAEVFYRAVPYPDSFPPLDRLSVSGSREIWVRRTALPGQAAVHIGLSEQGSRSDSVLLPPKARIVDSDRARLLVIEKGDYDEDIVTVYPRSCRVLADGGSRVP